LILGKISNFDANRCQILKLKCTKFDFLWGSAPDPAAGAYSAPADPLAVFKVPASKGRAGEDGEGNKEGEEVGRKWKERGGGSKVKKRGQAPNILA